MAGKQVINTVKAHKRMVNELCCPGERVAVGPPAVTLTARVGAGRPPIREASKWVAGDRVDVSVEGVDLRRITGPRASLTVMGVGNTHEIRPDASLCMKRW